MQNLKFQSSQEMMKLLKVRYIRFAIQSSLVPDTDLIIEISIDSPNDSISESTPMRIALQAGSSTHLLELATRDDDKLESNEVVTLTINEQPTYTVSDEDGSASVTSN